MRLIAPMLACLALGLATAASAAPIVLASADGFDPRVGVLNEPGTSPSFASGFAFAPAFTGGVEVAIVGPDGLRTLVAGTAGGAGQVSLFKLSDLTLIGSFLPFSPSYTGGVRVAAGEIGGADHIVTGAANGSSHVKIFDAGTLGETASFFAFDPAFTGGVSVGLNFGVLAVGQASGGSHVKVFDGTTLSLQRSFLAFDPAYAGGVRVAVGRVGGATTIFVSGDGGHVKAFDHATGDLVASFFAASNLGEAPTLAAGTYDGQDVLVTGGYFAAYRYLANALGLPPVFVQPFSGISGQNVAAAFDDRPVVSPIPEPATWAVLIGGLFATGGALRRVRRVRIA